MTFVETSGFSRRVSDYLSDDEYAALQGTLTREPEKGKVIRGTGGVRKIRWGLEGRGQRGGLRVIYYYRKSKTEIWMLALYAKNETESMPAQVLKRIRETIENVKS